MSVDRELLMQQAATSDVFNHALAIQRLVPVQMQVLADAARIAAVQLVQHGMANAA